MKKSLILGVCVLSACATFDSVFAMDNLDNLDNSIAKAIEIQKAAIKTIDGYMNTGVVPQAEKLSDMYDSIKNIQPNLDFVNNVADTAKTRIECISADYNNFINGCQDKLTGSNQDLSYLSNNIDVQINAMQNSFAKVLTKYRNMVPYDSRIAKYKDCELLAMDKNILLKDQLSLLTQQKNALKCELRNKRSTVIAEAKRMLEEKRVLTRYFDELNNVNASLKQENETLITEYEAALKQERATNAAANEKLKQELAATEAVSEKLKQELAATEAVSEKLKQERATNAAANEKLKQELAANAAANALLTQECAEANKKLEQELAANAAVSEKLKQERATNAAANEKLKQELAATEAANEKLKQENEELGNELIKAKKSLFGKIISFVLRK